MTAVVEQAAHRRHGKSMPARPEVREFAGMVVFFVPTSGNRQNEPGFAEKLTLVFTASQAAVNGVALVWRESVSQASD